MEGTILTPKEIVNELDRHIIGQSKAKRAVAIALRNRYRRAQLAPEIAEEIIPKNILMIGPTGVGKTEIARRLASLAQAPFVKVEATKYTEIGYVGRDVEGMVRDLIEHAVRLVKEEKTLEIENEVMGAVENRLVELLAGLSRKKKSFPRRTSGALPMPSGLEGSHDYDAPPPDDPEFILDTSPPPPGPDQDKKIEEQHQRIIERMREKLLKGEAEDKLVEVNVEQSGTMGLEILSAQGLEEVGLQLQEMLGGMGQKKRVRGKVPVSEAREILKSQEVEKRLDMDAIIRIAIKRAEEHGIVFVDEIDKVAGKSHSQGPDVSREGVQRDILPLVEGTSVTTKYGPVRTDHILFIAAGAFHMSKPSDLIPEVQGRFPIRVELDSLTADDFKRILVEPENALTKQYAALLSTEGIDIQFTEDGIDAIAEIATQVNDQAENIGARRLSTVLEKVLEEVSFEGSDLKLANVVINREYVRAQVADIAKDVDLSRYIL
ncbi:MAG: ATP-dependent protease ATPase subunit HslU [bacterium]|nr:ATP-dependent protease ATPase subunit HslU [bacterium]